MLGQTDVLAEQPDSTQTDVTAWQMCCRTGGSWRKPKCYTGEPWSSKRRCWGHSKRLRALNLAIVLALHLQFAEAASFVQRLLAVLEGSNGFEDHHLLLATWAVSCRFKGGMQKRLIRKAGALALVEAVEGRNSPSAAMCCSNLAHALKWQAQIEQAEALHRRAPGAWQASSEANCVRATNTRGNLANLSGSLGRLQEAEKIRRRALRPQDRAMGSEKVHAARACNNLADVLRQQGKSDLAEDLRKQALKVMTEKMVRKHMDKTASLGNLAVTLLDQE